MFSYVWIVISVITIFDFDLKDEWRIVQNRQNIIDNRRNIIIPISNRFGIRMLSEPSIKMPYNNNNPSSDPIAAPFGEHPKFRIATYFQSRKGSFP